MNSLSGLETLRESWCLIVLDTEHETTQCRLTRWALGDANADELLHTEEKTLEDAGSEAELLTKLGSRLNERRYEDTTLVTASERTLPFLRSRFLSADDVMFATLRGFQYVALCPLVAKYFDHSAMTGTPSVLGQQSESDSDTRMDVEALWRARKRIGPLVPADALRGTYL